MNSLLKCIIDTWFEVVHMVVERRGYYPFLQLTTLKNRSKQWQLDTGLPLKAGRKNSLPINSPGLMIIGCLFSKRL